MYVWVWCCGFVFKSRAQVTPIIISEELLTNVKMSAFDNRDQGGDKRVVVVVVVEP